MSLSVDCTAYSARCSLDGVYSRLNGLHMIQRPASGAFDLEFGVLAHAGQESFALTASEILQH